MIELFGRYRRSFLLVGIFFCLLAIVFTVSPAAAPMFVERGLSRVITPLQRSASTGISWVQDRFSTVSDNRQLLYENQRLQEQISNLLIENYRLRQAGEDNAQLSALLEINQRYAQLSTIGARVIGANPNDWYHRFVLNRGTNHGITNNMPVLGDGGLVGVVRRVLPNSSHFVSVIDSDFSAAVMSSRTGDIGEIRNDIRLMQQGLMRMDRISAAAEIVPGDIIVTSTHSSIFPPSIRVGVVESIHPNLDGHTRYALIRPVANLSNIDVVSIVTEVVDDAVTTTDGHNFITE